MPNKASLIQRIARKASATFRSAKLSSNGDNKDFHDVQGELVALVASLRAADLKIPPRKTEAGSKPDPGAPPVPPVTYMHICETDAFSMGVFLLADGASIPLHDHPGMNGMLKVLYGKVSIRSFDKLEPADTPTPGDPPRCPQFVPPLPAFQSGSLRRAGFRSVAEFSADCGPCLLTPHRDNVHQIDAVEGPAAFLDILSPPYDPEDGRDCHYYRVLQPASAAGTDGKQQGEGGEEEGEESWLLEVPQPEDFWCGAEPYPGPGVSV